MLRFWALPIAAVLIGLSVCHAEVGPLLSREGRWEQGKKYLAEGQAREAKEVFQGLLGKYPAEPDLHLFFAISSLRLGEVREAESHIKMALGLAPDHVEARTLLGWIDLEVRRDFPAAIAAYARVVELRPNYPEAYNNLGVALRKNGDLDEALESFRRALALREGYAEAWSNRGWVYVEQKKWREAQRDFRRALELNQQDEGALYGLSQALRGARDYAGAQHLLGKLVARSSNFVYWLEWAELGLVRYYWVLLLVAGGFLLRGQYKKRKMGVEPYGS